MKSVKEYLYEEWDENSGRIIKKSILNTIAYIIGSYQNYDGIDGPYMAVYEYWDHNVMHLSLSENEKWFGYEITPSEDHMDYVVKLFNRDSIRLVVPMWIMNLAAKNENHARNLFNKYLKVVK